MTHMTPSFHPHSASLSMLGATGLVTAILLTLAGPLTRATTAAETELVVLTADNWREYVPRGKEVDAILGDYVLRNDRVTMTIAKPLQTRNANMTVRGVGGCILDLTRLQAQSDQLSCFYPLAARYSFTDETAVEFLRNGEPVDWEAGDSLSGESLAVRIASRKHRDGTRAMVTYELKDGESYVHVTTKVINGAEEKRNVPLRDSLRADRSFKFGAATEENMYWAYDEWFRQAYGLRSADRTPQRVGGGGVIVEYVQDGNANIELDPAGEFEFTRQFIPAGHLLGVRSVARRLASIRSRPQRIEIVDAAGPVNNARLELMRDGESYGIARTATNGRAWFSLPAGEFTMKVTAVGRPAKTVNLSGDEAGEHKIELGSCGYVSATISDENGGPIPCKVGFYGVDGTDDPYWGPDSRAYEVQNLRYSHDGRFQVEIGPGKYEVVISRGPEYDAVVKEIAVVAGETTELAATLKQVVDSTGWVSTEYHSHSTPSGDNTSMQMGRVLNLIAEHIEFAPCTEHNRIDSYMKHLKRLEVEHLMATCPGMELTGGPLPVNHQNAFPLRWRPRTQDGGAPVTDGNPVVQIERLAMWDNGSDKLVQTNHPNLVQILGDRDTNGEFDEGFRGMFGFMDVIEIHPPARIFERTTELPPEGERGNVMFNWLQLLNQGFRIPGVVNTDAHYNFHGSGWLRNYVKSSTDDPAEIDTMEMVHASEQGKLVMTTGPFMEVRVSDARTRRGPVVGPGEDLKLESGVAKVAVKVQCANWLDINRVQIFLNGTMPEELNFTRRTHPDLFANGVVKIDRPFEVALDGDTHIIVAVAGEGLQLGRVMGEQFGTRMPVAVSNPVFVDVDGDGFQANGDKLGAPLPAVSEESR